jgi:lycopene beta-cyclase
MPLATTSYVTICGAGASGLAVADFLSKLSPESDITLIDPDFEHTTNKTWCFWDKSIAQDSDTIHKSWNKISVINYSGEHKESFNHDFYFCIHSSKYRKSIIERLKNEPRVNLVTDSVATISSDNTVITQKGFQNQATHVIDSRFQSINDLNLDPVANTLWQHFTGWVIETKAPVFDPDHAILMDFRVTQEHGFAFIYILPYSDSKALVELTFFNAEIPTQEFYAPILEDYLVTQWGLSKKTLHDSIQYSVVETEYGIIPMTDLPIQVGKQHNLVKTGLSGGLAKASTGYAFSRSQRHARILAKAIASKQDIKNWSSPVKFQFYDMLILHLLKNDPKHCVDIFMTLFSKNGFQLVFDFLDEKTTLAEDLKIMSSVPSYSSFFRAIWKTRKRATRLVGTSYSK